MKLEKTNFVVVGGVVVVVVVVVGILFCLPNEASKKNLEYSHY